MAGTLYSFIRNYDSADNTQENASSTMLNSTFPAPSYFGWDAPSGSIFKEWNANRDASGTSYQPGDALDELVFAYYAIWAADPDYLAKESELTSIANAIRTKGGTSASLSFPAGFVSAIAGIPTSGATLTETNIPVDNNFISFGQSIDYLLKIDIANQELYLAKMDAYVVDLSTYATVYCCYVQTNSHAFFSGADENGYPLFVEGIYDGLGGIAADYAYDFSGNMYEISVQNFKWYTLE